MTPAAAAPTQWRRRQRLERQLHDGASLRISALALRLGLLGERDDPEWREHLGELQDELHTVLQELRDVANQIYPPLLDEAGLGPALRELADRRNTPISVDADSARFGPDAEGAAYFGIAECLPAGGPLAVTVRRVRGDLVLTVRGLGAEHLHTISDQVGPLGGTATLDRPDTITVRIPCE